MGTKLFIPNKGKKAIDKNTVEVKKLADSNKVFNDIFIFAQFFLFVLFV